MDRKSLVILILLFIGTTLYYQWLEKRFPASPGSEVAAPQPKPSEPLAPAVSVGAVPSLAWPRLGETRPPALLERTSPQEKILLDTHLGIVDFLQLQPYAVRGDVPEPRILQERASGDTPGSFWVDGMADGASFPQIFRIVRDQDRQLVLEAANQVVAVTKSIRLSDPPFTHQVTVEVKNLSAQPLEGIRFQCWGYLDFSRVEPADKRFNQFLALKNGSIKRLSPHPKGPHSVSGPLMWIGVQQRYFAHLLAGPEGTQGAEALFYTAPESTAGALTWRLPPFRLDPGQARHFEFTSFIGPLEQQALVAAGHEFYRAVDFGWFSWFGHILLTILRWLHRLTHNWGIAIILLSVLVKLFFQPFTRRAMESMHKMQKLQPQVHRMRERLKSEPAKLNQEMFALYKKNKVNPMGGCLPMLLQMPIFIALYHVLTRAIDIRHSKFMGWIDDLSAPDVLWSGRIAGFGLELHLLPILMGVAMWFQQKISMSLQGPETVTDQQKMMAQMMPILFTLFFYSVPSGLVLYWLINTILTSFDYYWMMRKDKMPMVLDPA